MHLSWYRAVTVLAGLTLAASAAGCGIVGSAHNATSNGTSNGTSDPTTGATSNDQLINELNGKASKAKQTTYQAEYRLANGATATVAQRPPASATIEDSGRLISTADAIYICQGGPGKLVCEKTPQAPGGQADPGPIAGAGEGLVSVQFALGTVATASRVPGVKLTQATQTIAGVSATCVTVSGLAATQQNNGDPNAAISGSTVCVTDDGVLARYDSVAATGATTSVVLTKYSSTVDDTLLQVPPDAQVIDLAPSH